MSDKTTKKVRKSSNVTYGKINESRLYAPRTGIINFGIAFLS